MKLFCIKRETTMSLHERALVILERLLEPEHPDTQIARAKYQKLLHEE